MDAALAVTEKPKRGKSFTRQVGARIAFYRERAGLSQTETAKRARLAASHLCNMEKGARSIDVEKLHEIARALNCKVADLIPAGQGGSPLSDQLRFPEGVDED